MLKKSETIRSKNPDGTITIKDFIAAGSKYLPTARMAREVDGYMI